jgi:methyl-CpG-binding domain protein 4
MKLGWLPPVSPYGLIQEQLWPNEWKILIVCMMLNQTRRGQVERVLPDFFDRWPNPQALLQATSGDVCEVIRSLGFAVKRTDNLFMMTRHYLSGPWQHARELPGIGEYGARSWEIFCQGIIGDTPPKDHALVQWWNWYKQRLAV